MIRQTFPRPFAVRFHLKSLRHVQLGLSHCILRRPFHSNVPGETVGVKQEENASHGAMPAWRVQRHRFYGPRRQFMITTTSPSSTTHMDILSHVSDLFNGPDVPVSLPRYKGIVILATPSFATWLEDDKFISELLDSVFPGCKSDSLINAVLAVVDGLPPDSTVSRSAQGTAEGFAFLPCTQSRSLPGLWKPNEAESLSNESHNPRLSFTMGTSNFGLHVELPLANTLFRNGRSSTLLATKWRKSQQSPSIFTKETQIERISQVVFNPEILVPWLTAEIPVTALTPPRQIVSGLGNIVRQISGAENLPISASQELEIAVNARIQTMQVEKHSIAVWALVTSNDEKPPSNEASDIELMYLLFRRGASLHRVLSGGGGWGLKQGLLSLDPETTLADAVDARYDFDMPGSTDSGKLQALGNIARPGSWVQFFSSQVAGDREEELISNSGPRKVVPVRGPVEVVLGCIPSSIDEIPQDKSSISLGDFNPDRPIITTFRGHFGAQSEKGMYVRFLSRKPGLERGFPIRTKIDVPFSYLRWVERQPGQLHHT